jgi:hypothetical protein
MSRVLVVLAVVLLPFTLAAQCGSTARGKPSPTTAHCEEDQSCWDCTTMGNGKCDPSSADL